MHGARAVVLIAMLAAAGCAAVTTADGRRIALTAPEFQHYVERVFRDQNRLADEVGFALEGATADGQREPPALAAAEAALLDACAGVNELAAARRDGRRLGLRRSARAARSTPGCEAALHGVTAVLQQTVAD
jgi:hypothetical protein